MIWFAWRAHKAKFLIVSRYTWPYSTNINTNTMCRKPRNLYRVHLDIKWHRWEQTSLILLFFILLQSALFSSICRICFCGLQGLWKWAILLVKLMQLSLRNPCKTMDDAGSSTNHRISVSTATLRLIDWPPLAERCTGSPPIFLHPWSRAFPD